MFHTEIKNKQDEDISIMLSMDNHSWNYICDCGEASNYSVKEIQNTKAVFISHTHIDHFANFDSIIRHQLGIQRRVVICGPEGIAQQVAHRIKSYTWNLVKKGEIVYEIREIISEEQIQVFELEPPLWDLKNLGEWKEDKLFSEKSFAVDFTILDHKTPSIAYLFAENDTVKIDLSGSGFTGGKWIKELKDAYENQNDTQEIQIGDKSHQASDLYHLLHVEKGDTVGIIMDHAAHAENHRKILKQFKGVRKVLIESFFKSEDQESAEKNYHSYSLQSGRIMREAQVKEAIPVHFSRKYKEEEIEELLQEFRSEYNNSKL